VKYSLQPRFGGVTIFAIAEALTITALLLLGADLPVLLTTPIVALALAAPVALLIPMRVSFGARELEVRWLFWRRRTRYGEIVALTLDRDGVLLGLRGGGTRRLRVETASTYGDVAAKRTILRDQLGYVLSTMTGLVPTSGPIERIGDRAVSQRPRTQRSDRFAESLRVAARIAAGRGAHEIAIRDFIRAIVVGPDRALLTRAGLSSELALPAEHGAPYRDTADPEPSAALWTLLDGATVAVFQRGRDVVEPVDALVELMLDRDAHVAPLIDAGLTLVRLRDALAHDFSAAESDARFLGEVPDHELFTGSTASRAAITLVNDDYTTFEFVVGLVHKELQLDEARAAALAKQVNDEGRARGPILETARAAAVARRMMQTARLRDFPLRVVLEAVWD